MNFVPLFKPVSQRPVSEYGEAINLGPKKTFGGYISTLQIGVSYFPSFFSQTLPTGALSLTNPEQLRDACSLSTWILFGACLQGLLLLLLPGFLGLAPAFLLLGARIADMLLLCFGLKRNNYMDGVIDGKFSVKFPNREGRYTADDGVCVLIIGAKSNHALGMLGPGFKEVGDYFNGMAADLGKNPEEYGCTSLISYQIRSIDVFPETTALSNSPHAPFPLHTEPSQTLSTVLGMSAWTGQDRSASNQVMSVAYFRTVEGLHKFAHDPLHREAWTWWNKTLEQHPHISIMHEVFYAPKNCWEGIYINYKPTGLAATTHRATISKSDSGTEEAWLSPVVDAKRGLLRSSAGRMGRDAGTGNEKYKDDPYADV
ncbi:MAG: hypothetical protein M1827_002167 [Pycnora praestabilis]|nr:MAG: hypothetical protein M1827_002167 [Pycnora praestabilis]